MKVAATLLLVILLPLSLLGQDSTRSLSAEQVRELVLAYHPVARQAKLMVDNAKAGVTIARGLFDPVLENESARKTFDGTDYYNYNRPELNIPAWFGGEIRIGLEDLSGNRTDPSETKGQTSFAGITVPLAKNLLMDKRRAALQTAKIFRDASPVEQRNILNNLLQEAIHSYWDWARQYQEWKILERAVTVNQQRLRLVQTAFRLGDRPAIDTIEALTQLQSFELMRNDAWLGFQNAGLELSQFLWQDNNNPVDLPENVMPADRLETTLTGAIPLPLLDSILGLARRNHPELQVYSFKLEALNVEKKLKFQELLPSLQFTYNQLGKGYDLLKTLRGPLLENNFRYGFRVGIPLRLSQGRGEYRVAKNKILETQLQQQQKSLKVETTVKKYFNELSVLQQQISLQEQAYRNYAALQQGEETRFRAGESSLFLINARENSALNAFRKLQELKAKFFKARVSLQWASGLLAG